MAKPLFKDLLCAIIHEKYPEAEIKFHGLNPIYGLNGWYDVFFPTSREPLVIDEYRDGGMLETHFDWVYDKEVLQTRIKTANHPLTILYGTLEVESRSIADPEFNRWIIQWVDRLYQHGGRNDKTEFA